MRRWIDHTAEVELRIEAGSEQAVFEEALAAVSELLGEPDPDQPRTCERVELRERDRATLLAGWLDELVFLAETRGLLPIRSLELSLDGPRLEATFEAGRGEPRHLVKAVTYHRLLFERSGDRWIAGVVLDV
jgi:SHS2 domain-containing protein